MTEPSPHRPASPRGLPLWFIPLQKVADGITMMLNIIGTLLIFAVMVLVNWDVIGRVFFNHPLSGVPEIVSMSIVAIVFFQVAQAFRKGRLTRADAILNMIEARAPKLREALELVFALAAMGLVWELFWASKALFVKSWVRNTYEGTIGDFTAPVWPVKLVILIGCAALFVQIGLFAATKVFALFARPEARQ